MLTRRDLAVCLVISACWIAVVAWLARIIASV